jgi:hypothetical protein
MVLAGMTSLLVGLCPAAAAPYELPDAELNVADFSTLSGYSPSSSTLDGKDDVPGPGVLFLVTLTGADNGKLGLGDPWPTNSVAGLGPDPVLHHYTSLAAYDSYRMTVRYLDGPPESEVNLSLILNTGLTGPSGYPSNDPTNDTFWAGPWVTLAVGQTVTLALDFSAAEAWNIADNKAPHTGGGMGWNNGGVYSINDRDRNEVSSIGLQVADFDTDAMGQQLTLHLNVPEPVTLSLLALGGLAMIRRRK